MAYCNVERERAALVIRLLPRHDLHFGLIRAELALKRHLMVPTEPPPSLVTKEYGP